jgi:hypothetical protein
MEYFKLDVILGGMNGVTEFLLRWNQFLAGEINSLLHLWNTTFLSLCYVTGR